MNIQEEKKVEYIELIYDLIFVYLIGKNASLLDRVEAGFVSFETFGSYLISTLLVIQIWTYTTMFVNRFGQNSIADKLMMLVNMFLLYFLGANTIFGWDINYGAFMGSWSLILINLALQYIRVYRGTKETDARKYIHQNTAVLLIQASFILLSIPVYYMSGLTLGPWAILIGFFALPFLTRLPVNFAHLSERVMLYVVFTFGDMILIIADYFTATLSFEVLYFALTTFLIVAGLFFSYGFVYDRLLDRNRERSAGLYMLLHIFIILSLSCLTTSFEFMRDSDIKSMPKTIMMTASILVFFIGLALTEHWSLFQYRSRKKFLVLLVIEFVIFILLMILSAGKNGYITAGIALVFVYIQLVTMKLFGRHTDNR